MALASRGQRRAHKRSYVGKTSSKVRKGYRHGNMRKRRKQKNKDKKQKARRNPGFCYSFTGA